MRIGIQSIIWGPTIGDLDQVAAVAAVVAGYGFGGIEFSQVPKQLPRIDKLLATLADHNLELIGLAGGSLEDRITYCGSWRGGYLYVDDYTPASLKKALAEGFTLAVHPHLFQKVARIEDAVDLFAGHPNEANQLKLLPDTAHLYIAGQDPVAVIRKHLGRLAGVHLKDWTPLYGRSYHRYARGFVELGRGDVPIGEVLNLVQHDGRCPWLVAELDTCPPGNLDASLRRTVQWLAGRGLLPRPRPLPPVLPSPPPPPPAADRTAAIELGLIRTFFRIAHADPAEFYATAAAGMVAELPGCDLVTIAACNRAHGFVNLLGVHPPPAVAVPQSLGWTESVSQFAVDAQDLVRRPLPDPELSAVCPLAALFDGFRSFISVPVRNTWNPHHIRFVVNLFSKEADFLPDDGLLRRVAGAFGVATDVILDGWCGAATGRVARAAQAGDTVAGFVTALCELVGTLLDCRDVAVFLVNEAHRRLDPVPPPPAGDVRPAFVPEPEMVRAWERNQAILTRVDGKAGVGRPGNRLFAPMRGANNHVFGIIRCANPANHSSVMFTDDHVAVLDAVGQGAVPHLTVLRNREATDAKIVHVVHELSNPVVAIQGAAEFLEHEVAGKGESGKKLFSQNFIGDILSWSDLMRRLLKNSELTHINDDRLVLQPERTLLLRDVVGPAVRQARQLLVGRNFDPHNIEYTGFKDFPALKVDRNTFQQVFFNLISNSVKYAFTAPEIFAIEIVAERTMDAYQIRFRDWGVGVNAALADRIFEDGFRAPEVVNGSIGHGVGLGVIRRVIQAHGGSVRVTRHSRPTEFTIQLPLSLHAGWPRGG